MSMDKTMSMDRQIYSLSISGDENKARGLLGIGRKLLGMASEDMRKNNVDSWKHRLHSNDGNVRIDVLARADGNNKISIAYLSPGPEEPEPPKTRKLLLHCRIELTLCKEIPNYEKDPAYITVEPIPIPEGDEAENYKVRLHVFYDVGGRFELILKEEDEDDPDKDEKDKYQIPGTLSMEDAIPEVEKFTGYTHLEKTVDPALPLSEKLFVDHDGDYRRLNFPTDEWIDSGGIFEGYVLDYISAGTNLALSRRYQHGPINIRKFNYRYNDEEHTETLCDRYDSVVQSYDNFDADGTERYSETTEMRIGIRSEVLNFIGLNINETYADVRHIDSLGSILTEKKVRWVETYRYNLDGTVVTIPYYIDNALISTSFPFYLETQSSVEIGNEVGGDFTGIDGSFYKHKVLGEYANLFNRLFREDVTPPGMNWLTFPYLNYSTPKDLADVGGDDSDISTSPLSVPNRFSGISAPGRMVLELRGFFANTDDATTLKMQRKSYLAEWKSDTRVETYFDESEQKRYWKYGYNPFSYTRSDDEPEAVDMETSQNHNPENCPNFITEKGDLVSVSLFSAIYAIGVFDKVAKESVDISDRYTGELDLSYVTGWTDAEYPPEGMLQIVKGKRPWPKYLDCNKWEYVNAYSAGARIWTDGELINSIERHKYLLSIGATHPKELVGDIYDDLFFGTVLLENRSMYEAGDGSEEPATAESVIVNAIYRHLEEHGYDRYAPVCDIRLEAELYDKYE